MWVPQPHLEKKKNEASPFLAFAIFSHCSYGTGYCDITILSISKRNGPQPPPSHIKPISIYVWKRISIRRKKSKEVSQIAGLSKGKRGRNLVSTVALDHVCVHVWRRNVRQCTCACILYAQRMCMWKKTQPELVENIQPSLLLVTCRCRKVKMPAP